MAALTASADGAVSALAKDVANGNRRIDSVAVCLRAQRRGNFSLGAETGFRVRRGERGRKICGLAGCGNLRAESQPGLSADDGDDRSGLSAVLHLGDGFFLRGDPKLCEW